MTMSRTGKNILTTQIWQRIAALGTARGLDTPALAAAAQISQARMQRFAQGAETMRIDDLTGFSQALGVPISEILSGIENNS